MMRPAAGLAASSAGVWVGLLAGASLAETPNPSPEPAPISEPAGVPEPAGTVSASRIRPWTATTSHVPAQDIAAVPLRTAEDALRLVPGLTLVQHGSEGKGHQFFLRGFDAVHGSDLALTVEGIPVNEWSNIHAQGYIDLGFIVPEAIQSVDVSKGSFSLDQGAFAMAGSADYQLGISKGARGLQTAYTVGSTNRHRGVLTYSPKAGDGQSFIAIEALHDDGFGQNRAIDRGALTGRLVFFDHPTSGRLSLLGAGQLARFELPGTLREADVRAGLSGFYDAYDHAADGLSSRAVLALSHEWRRGRHRVSSKIYGGHRRLELLENFTGFLVDAVNGDRRGQAHTAWSFGATIDDHFALTDVLELEMGVGVRGDVLDQSQKHISQRQEVLETERALTGVQTISHASLGLRFDPSERVQVVAGARLDVAQVAIEDGVAGGRSGSGALAAVSPRATVQWQVAESLRLFAAYGRGFRPPEARSFSAFEPTRTGISEDLYQGGDPRLTVADSVELGARWDPHRAFGVSVAGFGTWIERESVFDHVSGINLELNRTRRLGGEVEIHSNPMNWLTLSADVTAVDARFVGSGEPIPLPPTLVGGFRAVLNHDSGFQSGLRFLTWAPRPLPHGAKGAAMATLDATVGYHWRALRFRLDVENLLNQQIREGEYHYASHWRRGESLSEIPVIHTVAGPPLNARLSVGAVF